MKSNEMTLIGNHSSVDARVDAVVEEMSKSLLNFQREDGHWAFELEADATIPAEYILLNHYLDEIDDETESKLAAYLRSIQGDDGGWPLYHDGDFNISASVKAYYALKLCGDSPDAPHMKRARDAIVADGGAARSNVLTRLPSPCSGRCRGGQRRSCGWKCCCFPIGSCSTSTRCRIGRGPSWCR
nr:prenyltransferase/squalene oxidase repeat-containing protein [Shumkonia mesophila]